MKEGYEDLEEEVERYLQSQIIESVEIIASEGFPATVIELKTVRITITAVGGHGGVGIHWYKIEQLTE